MYTDRGLAPLAVILSFLLATSLGCRLPSHLEDGLLETIKNSILLGKYPTDGSTAEGEDSADCEGLYSQLLRTKKVKKDIEYVTQPLYRLVNPSFSSRKTNPLQ